MLPFDSSIVSPKPGQPCGGGINARPSLPVGSTCQSPAPSLLEWIAAACPIQPWTTAQCCMEGCLTWCWN